jgi:rubrerythrin
MKRKNLYEKFLEKRIELFSDELDDWVFAVEWNEIKKILSENEFKIPINLCDVCGTESHMAKCPICGRIKI